jgi:hypothetical protein
MGIHPKGPKAAKNQNRPHASGQTRSPAQSTKLIFRVFACPVEPCLRPHQSNNPAIPFYTFVFKYLKTLSVAYLIIQIAKTPLFIV